jgi:hypothetical protein
MSQRCQVRTRAVRPVTVESIPDSYAAKSGFVSSVRCYLLIK